MKKGFTLSEVLITLGVIGVVAAMTLPILIQHHQKQVTVTQLKKAYSDLAQALQKAEAEHGLMETWNFADFTSDDDEPANSAAFKRMSYFGENYLFPYIKTVEKCIPTSNKCWADGAVSLGGVVVTNLTNDNFGHGSFVTASGYSVYYWINATGGGMWYYVDVNGKKAPNKVGKDIFALSANWGNNESVKKGVNAYGLTSNTSINTYNALLSGTGLSDRRRACIASNSIHNGQTCAAVIILDGWKISKNYPW